MLNFEPRQQQEEAHWKLLSLLHTAYCSLSRRHRAAFPHQQLQKLKKNALLWDYCMQIR